jgi:hypothetical protein
MKLNQKMEMLLIDGAKTCGLDPEMILCHIEERLTFDEAVAIQGFLTWLVANKKTFGYGNIQLVWAQYQRHSLGCL